ncbi:hypothetical protein OCU04_007140 [Sclerotinia nivalis]|uniref:Uncharacterized protein n=1 Tax=Sclerotinia nivalis TaxID=352851 RepID=A0A9X0DKD2_9HELO|nr:hypothetical protein OCU04_007140 [Sclerotinia nivalis]
MPPLSSIILGVQGGFNFLNGAVSLLSSSAAVKNAEILLIDSKPAVHTLALSCLSIGTSYLISAYRRDTLAMWMTVVGRTIAVGVFWSDAGPWRKVALFEGFCGGLLATSLIWESQYAKEEKKD